MHPLDLGLVIAQQTTPGGAAPSAMPSFLFLILMIGAMWFLLFAPQRKKEKEHRKLVDGLAAGDEVLTAGGIYGEITSVRPDRFIVRIGDNTKVEIGKSFIQGVVKKANEGKGDKK
ncbi:MAG: preprotein translocase subunit YajC [Verrucomicrobia bacterium RIFCSPLOWO2_12_FULL_64_8]|nr:MAG: preprotein translocase subunit YajC [Verrucomicrobia bacterium RIFCSPLOWO2_12_FULL_64_8]